MKDEAAIIALVGRDRNPSDFLERFVSEARVAQPYPEIVWDSVAWDITSGDVRKRAHLASRVSLVFAEHATRKVSSDLRVPFIEGFSAETSESGRREQPTKSIPPRISVPVCQPPASGKARPDAHNPWALPRCRECDS